MIAIGITTWNGLEHTKACIESLSEISIPFKLIIWDNGSTDGTKEWFKEQIAKIGNSPFRNSQMFFSNENEGMVNAWNYQLKEGFSDPKVDNVWICNNDIKFLKSTEHLNDVREWGLACPAILPKDVKGDLNIAAQIYHLLKEQPIEEGNLNGPIMAVSREAYEKVGLFDERLKNSYNDMDYHQRVIHAGLKTCVYNEAWIWHFGGASTSQNPDCHNKEYLKIFREKH